MQCYCNDLHVLTVHYPEYLSRVTERLEYDTATGTLKNLLDSTRSTIAEAYIQLFQGSSLVHSTIRQRNAQVCKRLRYKVLSENLNPNTYAQTIQKCT
jgi:hypothetical protein